MNYLDLFRVTLPETVLEVSALVVLLLDLSALRRASLQVRVAIAVALGVAGSLAAAVAVQHEGAQGLGFGSGPGAALLATGGFVPVAQTGILVLTAMTLLLLVGSVFTKHVGEFVAVVLMAAAGGLVIAAAQDLLIIFIGLELLSIGLYVLTAFAKRSAKSAEAAIKYYLFGGMSAAFLLFGFSYFYGLTGTTNVQLIQSRIALTGPSPLFYVAWILVVAGLGFKIAVVPFHLWAPDAYEGAPAPAAAFIASVSKVASFALLVTLGMNWWLKAGNHTWPVLGDSLLIVATASMVLGNLAALAQTSVRRLLAYSAIAHGGYILLALGAHPMMDGAGAASAGFGSVQRSMASVLYYALTYGLTTIGAFGVVAVVERATGSDRLDAFLGLRRRNPLLAGILLILFLSLAGIPPLVGFWVKFNLFAAVLGQQAGRPAFALVVLAIAMSAVSLYYYLQVLKRAYVMPAVDESSIHANPVTMLVLAGISGCVVLLGIFPAALGQLIQGF
jgi:NADH-quinone oxidoreductase subunit N